MSAAAAAAAVRVGNRVGKPPQLLEFRTLRHARVGSLGALIMTRTDSD